MCDSCYALHEVQVEAWWTCTSCKNRRTWRFQLSLKLREGRYVLLLCLVCLVRSMLPLLFKRKVHRDDEKVVASRIEEMAAH